MDPTLDTKQQYGELKRRLRQLIAENEIYKQEIAKVNDRLLRVTRDKAFLLDQLLPYEEDDSSTESELSDSDQDSHHPIPQPQTHTSSIQRRSQPPPIVAAGTEKNSRIGAGSSAEKPFFGTKKPRPPRPRKPRNPPGGASGGEQSGPGGRLSGGSGTAGSIKSGGNKGENAGGHNLDGSTGNASSSGGAGLKRSANNGGAQENPYLGGTLGGSSGHQKGAGSHKDTSGPGHKVAADRPLMSSVGSGSSSRKSGGGGGQRKKARLEQLAGAVVGQNTQLVQGGRVQHSTSKSASRHRSSSSINPHQVHHSQGGGVGQPGCSGGGRKGGSHTATAAATTAVIAAGSCVGPSTGPGIKVSTRKAGPGDIVSTNANVGTNHSYGGHNVNSSGPSTPSAGSLAAASRPTNPLTPEELERHLAAKQGARKIQALPPQPASLTLPAELFNEDAFLGDFAAEQIV
ncbi:INO80 complex subunit E isoformX2-like [Tropilaelaps mercedesae]|uniref:INO80 complex subunit E isoformX2-like n=1 Tax=Tropilaelaps mercedesae TaxID=418985 RepID=A0A1V9XHX0_9ACAR|nr:INO80 complex subunit E isoformX2-like [Tropilaelaps mercedesae]